MIMLSILAMAALVFISRYLFLEPKLPVRLRPSLQRLLAYSGPAVLTAIWAPIVFTHDKLLWLECSNPYIWAALLAGFLVWKMKNVMPTTVVSMAVFLLLDLVVFSV